MTPVTIYLLCLVTQRTGNPELGRTQPSQGLGMENRSENFSLAGSRGTERVTLGLSSVKQPFPGSPVPNLCAKVEGEGRVVPCRGWGESVHPSIHPSIHPSVRRSSAGAHNPGADVQPTRPETSSCIPWPPSPEQPALPAPAGGIPRGSRQGLGSGGAPGHPKLLRPGLLAPHSQANLRYLDRKGEMKLD